MNKISENKIEYYLLELLDRLGYEYLSPETTELERNANYSEILLKTRLRSAIDKLNPIASSEVKDQAFKIVTNLPTTELLSNNEIFHKYLCDGVEVEYRESNEDKTANIKLIDFQNVDNNEFISTNQFTIIENNNHKRPDVIIFINGLPLVLVELKNATDEEATIEKAFTQIQNYKTAISSIFNYNEIVIISDGLDAKVGTISSDYSRFSSWKSSDGTNDDNRFKIPQIETLVKGMLNKKTLLDVISNFIIFEKNKKLDPETNTNFVQTIKKVSAYHQYYAVNKAVESTKRAVGDLDLNSGMVREAPERYGLYSTDSQEKGDRKAGIFWHTQGSGKSLSMVFYSGKIVKELKNPTLVVITDRNDLDDQLFETFAGAKQLLRQDPVQAENRTHLKELLSVAGGGIVFTTIQKFFPEDGATEFDQLSTRKNIIVIADEAHRSQYGFAAKTTIKDGNVKINYGFAKYLRDAIPNASFIGFTGTPVEKQDASTPAVFGNYIDVYDIAKAVEDKATVPIYYESRLVKLHIDKEMAEKLDDEIKELSENDESNLAEKAKARWTQFEAIVGQKSRLESIAKDIVDHFEIRRESAIDGKAMIVTMSRRIAVELYEEIIRIKPEWHTTDKKTGIIKVVMTSNSSDPESWQLHHTNKIDRKALGERFKDPANELKLVIVRDMWLTGFDVPCLDTMYIDKLMQGANLMQAIARVNRVYKDKQGGLIVDYIGFASELKKALSVYTESGGEGKPTFDIDEAIGVFEEKLEIVQAMFGEKKFDYGRYFNAGTGEKLSIILESQEYILGLEDGKQRFIHNVDLLSKAFSLCVPDDRAMIHKDEVAFFQAVKARLVKFETTSSGKSPFEIDSAIRQIVDKAVVSDGIIDIFESAGIKKPDISILSDDFLDEVKGMEHKNIALELLKKILNDEIKSRIKTNLIQSKKFSEMLHQTIKKYQNNLLTAVEVIEELINIAKEIRHSDVEALSSGMTYEELAFYDALANNESAKEVMGNNMLRDLARVLVDRVRSNTTIDWTLRESVKANLRVIVKRTLKQYGYPPDLEMWATENVLKQAELFAEDWIN